jgi:hypothetical protein
LRLIHDFEVAALDQELAQGDRVIQSVPHNPLVTVETKPQEVIVLDCNLESVRLKFSFAVGISPPR